jgi:hypothetical protein
MLSHGNPPISNWSVARHPSMHMYVLIVLKPRMSILRPLDNKSLQKYLIIFGLQILFMKSYQSTIDMHVYFGTILFLQFSLIKFTVRICLLFNVRDRSKWPQAWQKICSKNITKSMIEQLSRSSQSPYHLGLVLIIRSI